MINFIKARPLNARSFSLLCQELGAEHEQLLFHTEVCWLSRGRVLHRLYELRSKVMTFLVNVNSDLAGYLDDPLWLAQLSYLVDIFDRLNSLNTSMQGRDANILLLSDKVNAFVGKLDLWRDRLINKNVDMFPNFTDCVQETVINISPLINSRSACWGTKTTIRPLFHWGFQLICLGQRSLQLPRKRPSSWHGGAVSRIKERHQTATHLQLFLSAVILVERDAWISSDAAVKLLLPFASTYPCEAGFSKLTLKTKYRNRLQVEDDLRLALSNIETRIVLLCKRKQAQVSHWLI